MPQCARRLEPQGQASPVDTYSLHTDKGADDNIGHQFFPLPNIGATGTKATFQLYYKVGGTAPAGTCKINEVSFMVQSP